MKHGNILIINWCQGLVKHHPTKGAQHDGFVFIHLIIAAFKGGVAFIANPVVVLKRCCFVWILLIPTLQ